MIEDTFTLSKPLKTHNGEITTLTLREPTTASLVDHGEPFKILPRKSEDADLEIEFFNSAMVKVLVDMIAEKVDDLIIKSIPIRDYFQLRTMAVRIILMGVGDRNPI